MPKGNTFSRLLIASLSAAAIAAPAAVAQPTDPVQRDMHASTVTKPASVQQDLRAEAAVADPSRPAGKDLRSEATADPSRAPSSSPGSFPGPPVWPTNPQPIASAPAPVADVVDGGDGGIDLPVALLAIAGTLALGGVITVAALKHRTRVAH